MSDITFTYPGHFFEQDWWAAAAGKLHEGSDELGQLEQFNVSGRTPVDTGALLADIQYIAFPNVSEPRLATIFADTTEQLAEWGRVYDLYQEGGLLGLSTYTNAPHEMFGKMFTDDISAIEEWGTKWLQGGMDTLAAGNG